MSQPSLLSQTIVTNRAIIQDRLDALDPYVAKAGPSDFSQRRKGVCPFNGDVYKHCIVRFREL